MLRMRVVPGTTHTKIFQSWFVRVWQGEYCFSLQLFQLNIANADKFDFFHPAYIPMSPTSRGTKHRPRGPRPQGREGRDVARPTGAGQKPLLVLLGERKLNASLASVS